MSKSNFAVRLTLAIFAVCISFPVMLPAYTINGSIVTLVAADRTSNNTALIQGFLNNATYTKIIIQPGTGNASWLVDPLYFNHNNSEIHLNSNTILESRTGGYPYGTDCVLKATSLSNIKVTGDTGAEILMHKSEYANLSAAEWRHAIAIMNCSNVTISGLTLSDTGGDGILIGDTTGTGYCSDVTITDIIVDGAARNGMSVNSVDGLTVTDCTFQNTQPQGNAAANGPWCGIDFEPDYPGHQLKDIVIDNCTFNNNAQAGFVIYAMLIDGSTEILNMTVTDCTMNGNTKYGIAVACVPASLSDSSSIAFENCTVNDNGDVGIWVDSKSKDAGTLSFTDCFLTNNNLVGANTAFLVENYFTHNTETGNIQLDGVIVEQPTSRTVSNFLSLDSTYGSIEDVSGTIQSFGGTSSITGDPANIDVTHLGIAVNKTSSASSSYDGTCLPAKANDGIYSQIYGDNLWACTNNQDVNAWWKVDLGQTRTLGKVRVQYREILGFYHLVPLSVTVQISDDNSNWTTVVSKSHNVPAEGSVRNDVPYEYPIGANARYVRLLFEDGGSTYNGYKLIEVTEVEITPLALSVNKTSSTSSSYDSYYCASKANDGVYFQKTTDNFWACANNQDVGAWWKIDLGQTTALGKVLVQYRNISGNYHFVPLSVTVQVSSDNSNWTTVVSKSNNVPAEGSACSDVLYEYPIWAGSTRYIRLLFEDGGSTYSGLKLIELAEVEIIPMELAVNKTSSASSSYDSSCLPAEANDGVYLQNTAGNFWSCANNQDVNAWWSINLGQILPLGKVRIQYRSISGNYHFVPLSVTVQVSNDNSNWTTMTSKSNNVPAEGAAGNNVLYEYPIGGVSARYIRLLFEDGGSSYSGYKLIELVEVEIVPCWL